MTPRRLERLILAVGPLVLSACELAEVAIPGGEPVIVVQAVLRPDEADQFVVLEQSFEGVTDPLDETGAIPPNRPRVPITGAQVELTNLDLEDDPCGNPVVFTRTPPPGKTEAAGVYWGPRFCPSLRAGDRIVLRIETQDGDVVTGTTRIPGMSGARLIVGGDTVPMVGDSATTFNRDRDTLRVDVSATVGRLLQVETRRAVPTRPGDVADVGTRIFADTTSITIPGTAIDVFFTASGDDVFLAGRSYTVVAALSDTNYYDFARSRNNDFTGTGFVNHLEGGIGVFGSLVAATATVWVTGDFADPREGAYHLQGMVDTIPVDGTMAVYFSRVLETSPFSALLDGTFYHEGPGPEGSRIPRSWFLNAVSVDGYFRGDTLYAEIPDGPPWDPLHRVYRLYGIWREGQPFPVEYRERAASGDRLLGVVMAERQ